MIFYYYYFGDFFISCDAIDSSLLLLTSRSADSWQPPSSISMEIFKRVFFLMGQYTSTSKFRDESIRNKCKRQYTGRRLRFWAYMDVNSPTPKPVICQLQRHSGNPTSLWAQRRKINHHIICLAFPKNNNNKLPITISTVLSDGLGATQNNASPNMIQGIMFLFLYNLLPATYWCRQIFGWLVRAVTLASLS